MALERDLQCDELYRRIQELMAEGATRYKAPARAREIGALIRRYSRNCDSLLGRSLRIELGHRYSLWPVQKTIKELRGLLREKNLTNTLRMSALTRLAAVTLNRIPIEENVGYRAEALEIARTTGLAVEQIVISNNWAFALMENGMLAEAGKLLEESARTVDSLTAEQRNANRAYEAIGRLLTLRAKVLIRSASEAISSDPAEAITKANALYESAIARDRDIDHRRVNEQIEWADELIKAHRRPGMRDFLNLSKPSEILEDAQGGLDSHECSRCRGYFYEVRAMLCVFKGDDAFARRRESALSLWRAAIDDCRRSIDFYSKDQHTELRHVQGNLDECERRVEVEMRPRHIFLSHSGKDTAVVHEYYETLKLLGFEPWMYEENLPAGRELDRALLSMFTESCAAVFFVTANFKDEEYLAAEVDYAVQEKRNKKKHFAIITLLLEDATGKIGAVPDLLRRYRWVRPSGQLDGLREIVAALPLMPSSPIWRDDETKKGA